jgi:hypothetical protein
MPAQSYTYYVSSVELQVLWNRIRKAEEKLRTTAPCTSTTLNGSYAAHRRALKNVNK